MIKRWSVFLFGSLSYALFLATFLYAIGFVAGFAVPTTIDGPPSDPIWTALAIDALLLTLFAVQHSVMARPAFKEVVTRMIPQPAERSLYVLASNGALLLLFWQWRPIGGTVWDVSAPAARLALYAVGAIGWTTVLVATLLIDHFDLFGMRQVWLFLRGKPYVPPRFTTPSLYQHIRHPLYVGWFLAFWGTPTMTVAHFFFAVMTTAYILMAIRLEERDLASAHGPEYVEYRKRVPMFVPRMRTRRSSAAAPAAVAKT